MKVVVAPAELIRLKQGIGRAAERLGLRLGILIFSFIHRQLANLFLHNYFSPVLRAGPWSSMYWQYYCTGSTTVLAEGAARVPVL